MLKDFYLRCMFFVLFICLLFCVLTFCDIDLLGGSSSRDSAYDPTTTSNYSHQGTKSDPLSLYADDKTIYIEMLKSIHNGERNFYFDVDGSSSSVVKERLSEIDEFYLTSLQSIYPKMISICQYHYQYLGDGGALLFTLSDIHDSINGVKNAHKDYQTLCTYVKEDISELYSKGLLKKTMSDKEKSLVISKHIAKKATYDEKIAKSLNGPFSVNSTIGSRVHNPLGIYKGWSIVCDGYAGLYNVFMWELGIESYIVTSKTHAWNLAYLDGKWYHSDVTYSDPVTYDRGGNIGATLDFKEEYINLTYTQIKAIDNDHILSAESKHFVNTVLGLNY